MSLSSTDLKTFWGAFEKDPLFFGRKMFPKMFYTGESPSFHSWIADAMLNPTEETTVIVAARKRAKSSISTFLMPIHLALFKGYRYICIASLAGDRAKDFLENIKDFTTDPNISNFPSVFGDIRGNKWSTSQIDLVYKNEELGLDVDCRIRSLGTGMQFAGAIRRDVRPELIIFDDVEDDETVKSEDIIEKYMTKIKDSVLPSLDERRGHFVIIGTPYGHDSVLKRMYFRKNRTRKIMIPALVKDDEERDGYKLSDVLEIPVGRSVWEKQFPTVVVEKERRDWAENGDLDSWNAQKMCNFNVSASNYKFYEKDIDIYDPKVVELDTPFDKMNSYMLIDAAYKKQKTNDPAGIAFVSVDGDRHFWVQEAVEGRWGGLSRIDPDTGNKSYDVLLVSKAIEIAKAYRDAGCSIKMIGLESYAFEFLAPLFYQEMERENAYFPLIELKPKNRAKEDRIRSLIPISCWGKIHIKAEHFALKNQMLNFDYAQTKQRGLNILDAFAYLPEIACEPDVDEGNGCGSVANRKAWGEFIEEQGRTIGGGSVSDRAMIASLGGQW